MRTTNTVIGNKESGKYFEFKNSEITIKVDKGYIGSSTTYFDVTNEKLKINSTNTSNIFQIGEDSEQHLSYSDDGILEIYGEINIGGDFGKIKFQESDMYINDLYSSDSKGMTFGSYSSNLVGNIQYKNSFSVLRNLYTNNSELILAAENNPSNPIFSYTSVVHSDIETVIKNEYIDFSVSKFEIHPIKIRGILITDNTGITELQDGILSFHDNDLYVYKGSAWVKLT